MHRAPGSLACRSRPSLARARSNRPPPTNPVSILAALVAIAIALAIGFAAGSPATQARRAAARRAIDSREPAPPARAAPPLAPTAAVRPHVADAGATASDARDRRARADHPQPRGRDRDAAPRRRSRATRRSRISRISPRTAAASTASSRPRAGRRARYRQLVVDLENNAPPPFFGAGAPDDLKLIVGVGPVLERMLQQLGITTYRQIARWSERDIDEFDAKLPEFPGRIRRDAWVTQARALHASKYGAPPSARDR